MKEVELPSGKKLKITMGSFAESKDLYQAVLSEFKNLSISDDLSFKLLKDSLCILLSSKEVEEKLWVCMGRAIYNGEKITQDSFEEVGAREDYMAICYEVASENILPFGKGLYAKLSPLLEQLGEMKLSQK